MTNKKSTPIATPAPPLSGKPMIEADPSSLDIITTQFEEQVSRYYNAVNKLDQLAEKLKSTGENQKQNTPVSAPPDDYVGKLNYSMDSFNWLNNRLEATVLYLSKVI